MASPVKSASKYPSSAAPCLLPCPLCGMEGNPLAIFEQGIEHRFGMPVLPVADYGQARCRRCGLLYLNAPVSDDYLLELYSQENLAWQQQYMADSTVVWNGGTVDEEARRFSTVVGMVARQRDLRGARWLDFGCQTGELGEIAQQRFGAVPFGVEVSEDYAARADARWGGHHRVRRSIDEFLREGRQFDVISALETLEHLATPWDKVTAFRNALAPNGLLIVTVPSAQYFELKYLVFRAFRRIFSRAQLKGRQDGTARSLFGLCHTHPYNFSPASLRILLRRGGFNVTQVGGIGWSRRFRICEWAARGIAGLTGNSVQIFPSVVAIAKPA